MLGGRFKLVFIALLAALHFASTLDDLIAEESEPNPKVLKAPKRDFADASKKYSSQIRSNDAAFGQKTAPKQSSLDFRINVENLRASAAGNGKVKDDDDDEKTLAQQVADGKYGLIQNEIFPHGSKRPGIISYLPNPEVPKDTKEDFGGLDKDEIWLAEDHVLVLKGGAFPVTVNDSASLPWPPIDDYNAPLRQVEIPKNPKIPPPFPVQLKEDGPLEFIRGENGSQPPRPPYLPPFPFPPPLTGNKTFPYPVPPGPLPPFLANLPPGTAFLPPPGNFSDIDEDDPSIYYPPKYDFYYPQDNTTAVPPGPLVPGIILPPPPNFFSPEKPDDQENETDPEDSATTRPPFVAPAYLPSVQKPTKQRTYIKRPTSNKKTTITYVFPERVKERTTKAPGFTSPIYVPNSDLRSVYQEVPVTSPKPNHITIPENQTLKQDIYIITTEPPEAVREHAQFAKEHLPSRAPTLDGISPERHPLRSLIRPNVSVSYIGKVGHLPPSTPFPITRTERPTTETYSPQGHYITLPPPVTVTPVPIVKKVRGRPSTQNPHATFYFYEEPNPTEPTRQQDNEVSISPIDQFLKENFKPGQIPEYDIRDEQAPVYIPSKPRIRQKPKIVYTPQEEPPKLNALEIDYAGLSGLHKIKATSERPFLKTQELPTTTARPTTLLLPTTDGPFIPSNYYATANPGNIHFTPLDHSVIDDITMKYFTIFGQRLNNAAGTTPLTPVIPTSTSQPTATTPKPRFPPSFTTPQTVTTPSPPRTQQTNYIKSTTAKPRPTSPFEQYLKEITGEDQADYIITQNVGQSPKLKKAKSQTGFTDDPLNPYYIPYGPSELSQYIENIYRGQPSTTLRPIANVEIQPQYFPQISTTLRPYVNPPTQRPKPPSHNFGQYLQEVTYTGPQGPNPSSNLQYFDASTHSAVRQQYQTANPKPISLASDILVNYRQPLPPLNPDAEVAHPTYDSNSNIRVVQAPDLGITRNRSPYRASYQKPPTKQRPESYEPAKAFFENIPNTGYFAQPPPSAANAFVSYNLPGNGGHFYFLTPQALDRSDTEIEDGSHQHSAHVSKRNDVSDVRTRIRSDERVSSSATGYRTGAGYTSQDYLRRRRKKP